MAHLCHKMNDISIQKEEIQTMLENYYQETLQTEDEYEEAYEEQYTDGEEDQYEDEYYED